MTQLTRRLLFLAVMSTLLLTSCTQASNETENETAVSHTTETASPTILPLPELTDAALNGRSLKVIATTSIIGDVVAQVGGEAIELTTLIPPGRDPHSFEPGAQDLTAVSSADIIFVNGWDLEETLVQNLESIGKNVPIVPVAATIQPLAFDGGEHGNVDPHTWFNIQNVAQWTTNIETSLSQRDPAHAESYASNADAYRGQLAELETYAKAELSSIPPEKRFLITNHDALGYLADSYGLQVLGTVIPGTSTLSEPSAREIADLIATMNDHDICTIFTETTISDTLAQTTAAELSNCDTIQVIPLYTGSLGVSGSGADSYIGMFRANVEAIVNGLK